MPDTMKAVVLEKFGGYDAFELRDVSVPAVGPRQVRVRLLIGWQAAEEPSIHGSTGISPR